MKTDPGLDKLLDEVPEEPILSHLSYDPEKPGILFDVKRTSHGVTLQPYLRTLPLNHRIDIITRTGEQFLHISHRRSYLDFLHDRKNEQTEWSVEDLRHQLQAHFQHDPSYIVNKDKVIDRIKRNFTGFRLYTIEEGHVNLDNHLNL